MPRLFVALNFPKDICDSLYASALTLKKYSRYINLSHKENLHLTLAFIGETQNIKSAQEALRSITTSPFELILEGYSEFSTRDGSICFAKTQKNHSLSKLSEEVRELLLAKGFEIDTKPFKSHITLGRQFTPSDDFRKDIMEKLLTRKAVWVSSVSLMRSDRINGKLTYTEIMRKPL